MARWSDGPLIVVVIVLQPGATNGTPTPTQPTIRFDAYKQVLRACVSAKPGHRGIGAPDVLAAFAAHPGDAIAVLGPQLVDPVWRRKWPPEMSTCKMSDIKAAS